MAEARRYVEQPEIKTLFERLAQHLIDTQPDDAQRSLIEFLLQESFRKGEGSTAAEGDSAQREASANAAIDLALLAMKASGHHANDEQGGEANCLEDLQSALQKKQKPKTQQQQPAAAATAPPPAAEKHEEVEGESGCGTRAFPRGTVFVPIEKVAPLLKETEEGKPSNAILIDARWSNQDPFEHGKTQWAKAHAKHAFFLDIEATAAAFDTKKSSARHPLPNCADFIAWCRARGIGCAKKDGTAEETTPKPVFIMDDTGGVQGGCRVWWMLDNLGVEAYVLDGGVPAYLVASGNASEEERRTTFPVVEGEALDATEAIAPVLEDTDAVQWKGLQDWNQAEIASTEDVLSAKRLVDCRPPDRYNSGVRPNGPDPLPGHVLGAVNVPAGAFQATKTLKTKKKKIIKSEDGAESEEKEEEVEMAVPCSVAKEEATKKLKGKVYSPEADSKSTILHCFSGMTAAMTVAESVHCGLGKPRMYIESWSGYCGRLGKEHAEKVVVLHGALVKLTKRFPSAADVSDQDLLFIEENETGVTVADFCKRCTEPQPTYLEGLVEGKVVQSGRVVAEGTEPLPEVLIKAVRALKVGEEALVKAKFVTFSVKTKKGSAPP